MKTEFVGNPAMKPSVKITKCIGFQKFRYCGENRPGKKYQEKDFMQLTLLHMMGKNVHLFILCFDADNPNEIHPNGLVGRDCREGVYMQTVPVSKSSQIVRIPYLRTERILTKKTKDEGNKPVSKVFKARAEILPSPYKEQCLRQSEESHKYDTTKVCFGVIAVMEELDSTPYFCLSNVVQNASEKTMLQIQKLSTRYISAQEGGVVDIFTTEDGPPIIAGKCSVKVLVTVHNKTWESPESMLCQDQILYKRVVTYRVPPFEFNPATNVAVQAFLHLSCIQSGQSCCHEFFYEPGADSARRLASSHDNKPFRKRPYISDTPDDRVNEVQDVKLRVKEKVRSRQILAQPKLEREDPGPEPRPGVDPLPAAVTVMDMTDPSSEPEQGLVINVRDSVTGKVFRICSQGTGAGALEVPVNLPEGLSLPTSTLPTFTLLSDLQRTALASDYGAASATTAVTPTAVTPTAATPSARAEQPYPVALFQAPSTPTAATPSARAEQPYPVAMFQAPSTSQTTRKKGKFLSPWIVDEESKPLFSGEELSSHQPKPQPLESFAKPSVVKAVSAERSQGPLIATHNQNFNSGGSVSEVNGNLLSISNLSSLPSGLLSSLSALPSGLLSNLNLDHVFSSGPLKEIRFNESGNLVSTSLFDIIQPLDSKGDGN